MGSFLDSAATNAFLHLRLGPHTRDQGSAVPTRSERAAGLRSSCPAVQDAQGPCCLGWGQARSSLARTAACSGTTLCVRWAAGGWLAMGVERPHWYDRQLCRGARSCGPSVRATLASQHVRSLHSITSPECPSPSTPTNLALHFRDATENLS